MCSKSRAFVIPAKGRNLIELWYVWGVGPCLRRGDEKVGVALCAESKAFVIPAKGRNLIEVWYVWGVGPCLRRGDENLE
ncbi:hypothetical protein COR52_14885 [Vibrio mediterranei]|uniref:DUF3265 domain-containing protein n=1 Tax=Vibrio mediterranei TaxID=689 RepID=A0ABX5DFB0_9VIBR|nr:hypothetical protein COR52_14885 [Vibrio mediterranei]PRQ67306.1 hypothetical protein COR51_12070 [Vibrio mediterranei]